MKTKLLFLLTLFSTFCFAQNSQEITNQRVIQQKKSGKTFEKVTLFTEVNTAKEQVKIPKELTNFTVLSFDTAKRNDFLINKPNTISISIPNNKEVLSLELVKVQIRTDDFEITKMPANQIIASENKAVHYRGIVAGEPNSLVALSFFNDEISGLISRGTSTQVLGKLKSSKNHILYNDKDIAHLNDFVCGTEDSVSEAQENSKNTPNQSTNKNDVKAPRVFFDIGTDIVKDKGGPLAASNYVEALFNQVTLLYEASGFKIRLSGMKAWTSTTPFDDLLTYKNYRVENSFNGDAGHFVTYDYSGGVAFLNSTLCSSINNYAVSGINGSLVNVPTYSWSVYVISHELGHNFGSTHTQYCAWNGNNTPIDGCVDSEGGEPKCARSPNIPSDGGTIMSYCHVTSVGINFNKGFHPQVRARIAGSFINSDCVDTVDANDCKWQRLSGNAIDIGSGGGETFVVGDNKYVYQWVNNNWKYVPGIANVSRIDVNGGGRPWVIKTDGSIHRYERNKTWSRISGAAVDVGLSNGHVYVTNKYNNIYKYVGNGKWNILSGKAKRIDVNGSGLAWVVGSDNYVYQRVRNTWERRGDIKASDITVKERGYSVWIIEEKTGKVFSYVGNKDWKPRTGRLKNISAQNNGTLWGTNVSNIIYKRECSVGNLVGPDAQNLDNVATSLEETTFLVYPVPAKNTLNIELGFPNELFSLSIIDITGRVIQSQDIEANIAGSAKNSIDIHNLVNGVYFITLKSSKRTLTKKIIVKK